jgi:hypothetical protein
MYACLLPKFVYKLSERLDFFHHGTCSLNGCWWFNAIAVPDSAIPSGQFRVT